MGRKREKVVTEAVSICADTLVDLADGMFRRKLDQLIKIVIGDLIDRGDEDGKPRLLSIEIEFIKVKGVLVITPRAQPKLPPHVLKSTVAKERPKADGETEVLFQPWNAENAEQPHFAVGEIPNETE